MTFISPPCCPLLMTNQKTGLPHKCYKYLGVYIFTTKLCNTNTGVG